MRVKFYIRFLHGPVVGYKRVLLGGLSHTMTAAKPTPLTRTLIVTQRG